MGEGTSGIECHESIVDDTIGSGEKTGEGWLMLTVGVSCDLSSNTSSNASSSSI